MNFGSTLLVNLKDKLDKIADASVRTDIETEVRKADLDLLDKINKLGGTPGAVVVNPVADTAANFTSKNPTLQAGQLGYETDTGFFKFGDGTTAWTSLSYQSVKNAPLPQTAAGVGQWLFLESGAGVAMVLPAGGTWAWIVYALASPANALFRPAVGGAGPFSGVSAGGTTIEALSAGNIWMCIAWRIA